MVLLACRPWCERVPREADGRDGEPGPGERRVQTLWYGVAAVEPVEPRGEQRRARGRDVVRNFVDAEDRAEMRAPEEVDREDRDRRQEPAVPDADHEEAREEQLRVRRDGQDQRVPER